MAYCTLDDILGRIDEATVIQLTDDEGAHTVHTGRVDQAIADADDEINGYVGTRYVVPMSPAPAILKKLSVDVAIHNLFARRNRKAPEEREERYKAAIDLLRQISKGTFSLGPNDPDGNPPTSEGPEFSSENPQRTFTRGTMEGF